MYYFLSDVHLKNAEEKNAKILLDFLTTLNKDNTKSLYLLGDIFDLWIADHQVFINKFQKIIEELKRIKQEPIEVHYFEGNHDLYLKSFWQKDLGFLVHTGPAYFHLDGLQIRMEHGDQANPEDISYLRFRKFLRTPFMNLIAHSLSGKILNGIGNLGSKKSREQESSYPWNVKEVLKKHIKKLSAQEEFDVLISGHMHQKVDEEIFVNNKSIRNINLGWWGDGPKVLKLKDKEFSWIDLKQ